LFSDKPDRIVTSVSTADFIGNWSAGSDSFVVDVPDVVLVIDESERQQDEVIIIELFDLVYDFNKKTLKYQITLANTNFVELPEFGQTK